MQKTRFANEDISSRDEYSSVEWEFINANEVSRINIGILNYIFLSDHTHARARKKRKKEAFRIIRALYIQSFV